LDTTARGTNRNGKTETRPTLVVPERSHTKESITKPTPASVGRIKVRLATQAPLRGEIKPCCRRSRGQCPFEESPSDRGAWRGARSPRHATWARSRAQQWARLLPRFMG
jgi:hypothetical protein